ncbi:MAG: response regulator [Gammaproteobacteria bacterium]
MKILMIDDHAVILSSLAQMLIEEPDIEDVRCANSYADGVKLLAEERFDVAVLDIELPEKSGFEFAAHCIEQQAECRFVFLTGTIDRAKVDRAIALGANGYLVKTIDARDLVSSLRLVCRGIDVFDAGVSTLLQVSTDDVAQVDPQSVLSPQQHRVLKNVAKGMTNKEIARHMGISEKTARNYLASVFEKLGLQRRSEAAVWYMQHFGDPEPVAEIS